LKTLNAGQNYNKIKSYRKKFEYNNLRCIKAEVWKSFLPRPRRRPAIQRLDKDNRVVIIARGRRVGAQLF
jgi:hypothetical protein